MLIHTNNPTIVYGRYNYIDGVSRPAVMTVRLYCQIFREMFHIPVANLLMFGSNEKYFRLRCDCLICPSVLASSLTDCKTHRTCILVHRKMAGEQKVALMMIHRMPAPRLAAACQQFLSLSLSLANRSQPPRHT